MKKVKILLTGSKGFIGTHLKNRLEKDVELLCVDHIMLKNPGILKGIVMNFQPTIIIHMSAYGNIINQQDDEETIQANYMNLYNLLEASKYVDYEMFVNFSTSSVVLPVETFYSATKAGGERLCKAFASKYGKNIVSVRPYTVIGTGEPKEHLIPTLIRSCLEGTRMNFVGSPVHDFIGVDDFVSALKLIIEDWNLKGVIDIGTGVKTTNEEILVAVEAVTGKRANITRVDNMRNYDTTEWVADPTIIRKLGWKQTEKIGDIIVKMVDAYGQEKARSKNPTDLKKI